MKFYIRNFDVIFPEKDTVGSDTTSDGLFTWTRTLDDTYLVQVMTFNIAAVYPSFNNYFCIGKHGLGIPYKTNIVPPTNFTFGKLDYSPFTEYPFEIFQNRVGLNVGMPVDQYISTNWPLRDWTVSNLTTFKTELCTYFKESVNLPAGSYYFYPSHVPATYYEWPYKLGWEEIVDMIFLNVSFTDTPGENYYTQIFYEGNTAYADEEITV